MDPRLLAQSLSPFHDLLGIEMAEWRDGYCRLRCVAAPAHANRGGIVHGGVMLALLDQVNAFAGLFPHEAGQRRSAVTLDLDARFVAPGRLGAVLLAEGTLVSGGRSVFFARGEVRDEGGALLAFGASTHRLRAAQPPA